MDTHPRDLTAIEPIHGVPRDTKEFPSSNTVPVHGTDDESAGERDADAIQGSKGRWFAYLKTREFYLVLLLGYGITRIHFAAQRIGIIC